MVSEYKATFFSMKINVTIISRTNVKPVYYSILSVYPLLLFIIAELSSSFPFPTVEVKGNLRKEEKKSKPRNQYPIS